MLYVLMMITLLIAFIVLLVLFAAIDILFELESSGSSAEHNISIHWLLFSRQLSPADKEEGDDKHRESKDEEKRLKEKLNSLSEKEKKGKDTKKKKSPDMSLPEIFRAYRQLKSPAIRLIKGIIYAIRIPYARINAVYGFADPAYTGMACGYSYAAMSCLGSRFKNLSLRLEPDFTGIRLEYYMSGTIRIRLYRFIPAILLFVFNRNVLQFSWNFFIKNKSKKSGVNL